MVVLGMANQLTLLLLDTDTKMKPSKLLTELITLQNIKTMTFYHGINSDVKFEDLKVSQQAADYGEGLYLTTDKWQAQRHGKFLISGKVYPKNPIEIGSKEYFRDIYPKLTGSENAIPHMTDCSKVAKQAEYDAIIVEKNSDDIWCILLKDGLI